MYSSLKNIQILVSLLKSYGIKHIVISAGTRHTPLVYSLEHDNFFTTYSIVDERSASFFAIGLIEYLQEPVGICCTSGTAAANYVSAANEAFYQQLPLLIMTADRNHYYMFQQEEQMIPQEGLYKDVCKKIVTLPHVRDEKDFWYCSRICNEALSELRHRENGPVHINFIVENDYPIYQGIVKFDENKLPFVRKIDRLTLEDSKEKWLQYYKLLTNSKVLIVYGQAGPVSEYDYEIIQKFCDRFNCIVSIDLIANLHGRYCIPTYAICKTINASTMKELVPDIVITMNANTISEIKSKLTHYKDSFIHWHVSSKGEVSDPFKILSDIIECSPITFFEKFIELSDNITSSHEYYEMWKIAYERIGNNGSLNEETIEFSALYATQQFASRIPANSLLHIANSNSIRLINFFEIDPSIIVFGNRGAHGIDGSMSSFIGQSCVSKKLSFLVIGDLSFFYDMNALWNQYVGNNVRILVCNNSGGAIFHTYPNTINVPTLDEHIAAEHQTSVKDWVKSRGFKYLSANNKKEFDIAISQFMCIESDAPVLLEVFTDKEIDATAMKTLLAPYQVEELSFKDVVKKHVPVGLKNAIKKIIR